MPEPKTNPSSKITWPIISLDIETTDFSPETGRIIEIGAVKFGPRHQKQTYQQVINPQTDIPFFISSLTGITNQDVVDAPTLDEVKEDFINFLGSAPILGHNIAFDLNFLAQKDLNFLNHPTFDTWKLATILIPHLQSYSLESLSDFLKIDHLNKHRALDDAQAAKDLFFFLAERLKELPPVVGRQIYDLLRKNDWDLSQVFLEYMPIGAKRTAPQTGLKPILPSLPRTTPPAPFDPAKIETLFKSRGELAKVVPSFRVRPAQVSLASRLATSFATGRNILIDTPPGLGRALATLVPAVYFGHAKAAPVILAYPHIEQIKEIFRQEVPIIKKITPFSPRLAWLDQPTSYLCLRRFQIFQQSPNLNNQELTVLIKILLWLPESPDGHFSGLSLTPGEPRIIKILYADQRFCPQNSCPHFQSCYYHQALRSARKSSVALVTPPLLVSISQGQIELSANTLIIDSVQKLPSFLASQATKKLSFTDIRDLLTQIYSPRKFCLARRIPPRNPKFAEIRRFINKLISRLTILEGLAGILVEKEGHQQYGWVFSLALTDELEINPAFIKFSRSLDNFQQDLTHLSRVLTTCVQGLNQKNLFSSNDNPDLKVDLLAYADSCEELSQKLQPLVAEPTEQFHNYLLKRGRRLYFEARPVRLKPIFSQFYQSFAHQIMLGQSLTVKDSFAYLLSQLRLPGDYPTYILPPVHDYQRQSLLFLPTDVNPPSHPQFEKQTLKAIIDLIKAKIGRLIIVFPSNQAIKKIYYPLTETLPRNFPVIAVNISGGQGKISAKFKHEPKAVLLATPRFLERVNIPGNLVPILVLTKLPFPPPTSDRPGGFNRMVLPEAVLRVKNLFNQLIASPTDRGFMVILDRRLQSENYGSDFLQSLPQVGLEYAPLDQVGQIARGFFKQI